ncbi:MAG: phosphatase PAP2 family protein [Armatimonadota bacterium]
MGWIVVMLLLLIFGGRKERIATAYLAGGLVLTELVLMPYAREIWPRPRPYTYIEGIRALGVTWPGTSFPSAHMHLWTQATIVYGLLYRRWLWPLVVLTLLTAYSRPYAGMHHLLDVLGGIAVGVPMGILELWIARRLLGARDTDEATDDDVPDDAPEACAESET